MEDETKATQEEREELREARERRSKRYGIAPKEGKPLTPPAGYPEDEEQYGDPVNYAYPIDEEHIRPAIAYFNHEGQREAGGYTEAEWAIIGKRIAAAASRLLDAKYEYRDGRVVRVEEKAVKLLAETDAVLRIGGYAVVYGGKDLAGDTFTPETQLWLDENYRPPVFYDHTLHPWVKDAALGRVVSRKTDDYGVWVEAELDRHNEYVEHFVRPLLNAGALGYSSGSASHLVRRDGGVLRSWPVVEVSLTPTPCEPRTLGVAELRAMKSHINISLEQEESMSTTISVEELAKAVADHVAKMLPEQPQVGFASGGDKPSRAFSGFLRAVARQDVTSLRDVYGVKAMTGISGAGGGYLVPEQFVDEIFTVVGEESFVLSRATRFAAHGPLRQPVIDLEGGAVGRPAWYGGLVLNWFEEGAMLTESSPAIDQYVLNDHGLGGMTYVPNRLLEASTIDVDAWLRQIIGRALAWYLDWFCLRGDGVGKPLGILNSPATISVTRAGANNFQPQDAATMVSRLLPQSLRTAVWLMNPTVLPRLTAFAVGNMPVWQPNFREGFAGTLLGMPVIFTEKLPVLGTAGDVVLADFSCYAVLLPREMGIAVSEHYRFAHDQTTFRVVVWADGQPMVKAPARLADGTTTVSPFVQLGSA